MLLPCRCSSAFFNEERTALRQKRQKMRLLQQGKMSDVSNCKDLPDEIPLRLNIGTKVTGELRTTLSLLWYAQQRHWLFAFFGRPTARLRGVHDGLFTGQIDAVDTSAATYRVTFDRTGLGTHTVPDYEVLVSVAMNLKVDWLHVECSIFTLTRVFTQLHLSCLSEQWPQRDHAHLSLCPETADDALHAEPGGSASRTLSDRHHPRPSGW